LYIWIIANNYFKANCYLKSYYLGHTGMYILNKPIFFLSIWIFKDSFNNKNNKWLYFSSEMFKWLGWNKLSKQKKTGFCGFATHSKGIKQVDLPSLHSGMTGLLASRSKRGITLLATLLNSKEPQQGTFYGALQWHIALKRAKKRLLHSKGPKTGLCGYTCLRNGVSAGIVTEMVDYAFCYINWHSEALQ